MNKNKTEKALTERGKFFRIGLVPFYVRPLTLAQIYRIGAVIEPMQQLQMRKGQMVAPVVELLSKYKDLKICSEVVVVMMFRREYIRRLIGWYVRRHLTMSTYKSIVSHSAQSLNASFFLSSLTFLKGIKTLTEQTNTQEVTRRGDLSED